MSAQATVNVVDDEEMSSQGSVNAPVVPPTSLMREQVTAQAPMEQMAFQSPLSFTLTQWFDVAGTGGAPTKIVLVESTEVLAAPTVGVDAPSRAETKQAFADVSLALCSVSSQHDAVCAEMEQLSHGMEQMRMERAGELETTAQVKETL